MEEEVKILYRDLKYPDSKEFIKDWKIIQTDRFQLHYKVKEENDGLDAGFDFYAIEFVEGDFDDDDVLYLPNDRTIVDCIFHGIAYWDGIRHFYVGDEQTSNYGYLYCLDISTLQEALSVLQELEDKYCPRKNN